MLNSRIFRAATALTLATSCLNAMGEAPPVGGLLAQAPAGTVGVFVAPVLQDFLDQANAVGKTPAIAALLDEEAATLLEAGEPLADLLELTTGTTLGDVLGAAGIAGEGPAALYFGGDLEPAAVVLPVTGDDGTLDAVAKTLSGGVVQETIEGQEVAYNADELVGFFRRDDALVFALTRDALENFAGKKVRDGAWHYSTDAFPAQNEFALVLDPARLAKQPMLQEDKNTAAIADALAAQFDEFAAGMQFGAEFARLRLAAHDATPAEAAPALSPLTYYAKSPKDALAVASLRVSQGLKDFLVSTIKTATNNNPQVTNMSTMAMGMLGPEIAIAVTGELEDGTPEYLAYVPITDSPHVVVLLSVAGLAGPPEGEHAGVPIQKGNGFTEDFGIYLANLSNTLVLSNNEDRIKTAIDNEANGDVEGFTVPEAVTERGNHGFIYTPDKRGLELLSKILKRPLPEDVAEELGPTTLTIEAHTGWRQIAIDAPDAATLSALIATE